MVLADVTAIDGRKSIEKLFVLGYLEVGGRLCNMEWVRLLIGRMRLINAST